MTKLASAEVELTSKTSGYHAGLTGAAGLVARLAPLLGLGAITRAVIKNTSEAQFAVAQLEAALKSTGGAAGRTSAQLQATASALEKVSIFGDDAVLGAEALLLTFTQIRGATFDRATEAVLDLATAMGGDLKGAAIQVGKALNDPVVGMTALQRVGVTFSAAQKEVIKNLAETGRLAEAQALILKELTTEFGGSAEAARHTLGGALAALGNAWGNAMEMSQTSSSGIVDAINAIAAAVPGARSLVDAFLGGIAIMGAEAAVSLGELRIGWLRVKYAFLSGGGAEIRQAETDLMRLDSALKDVKAGMFAPGKPPAVLIPPPMPPGGGGSAAAEAAEKAATKRAGELEDAFRLTGERAVKFAQAMNEVIYSLTPLTRQGSAANDRKQLLQANPFLRTGTLTAQAKPGAGGGGSDLLGKAGGALKGLGSAIGGVLSALNPWQFLLEAIQRALGDFIVSMTPIVDILAAALMPILEALFPIFKVLAIAATYTGQVLFNIAGGIAKAIGWLIQAIGKAIDVLPFISGQPIIDAGKAMEALGAGFWDAAAGLATARGEIRELEWQSGKAAAEIEKLTSGTRNMPTWFRMQRARFDSALPGVSMPPGAGGGSAPVQDNSLRVGTLNVSIAPPAGESGEAILARVGAAAKRTRAAGGTTDLDILYAPSGAL